MLVLSRKPLEEIVIGDNIHIKVLRIIGGRVQVGVTAPVDIMIRRSEIETELRSDPSFAR